MVLKSFSRRQAGSKFTLIDAHRVTKMLTMAQFKIKKIITKYFNATERICAQDTEPD